VTHALLIAALVAAAAPSTEPERVWMVIGASDATPAGIARKAKALSAATPDGLIVQTADCGDHKNMFGWASAVVPSAEGGQAALVRLRATIKDAYVKRCDPVPRSLLSFRVPAVDASIADVPGTAVIWQDRDKTSSTLPLPDGRALIVVRYFVDIPNDPLEGKRERVMLADGSRPRKVLEDNCPSPGDPIAKQQRVAFTCAREEAGDQLLHSVLAFDGVGAKLAEIAHCRRPQWSGADALVCDEELVGPTGRLKLRAKRVPLAASKTQIKD
jgi:hypothetical protein